MVKKRKKKSPKKLSVICPYCNEQAELKDSSIVYRQSYGMIWICQPCKAWVGTHKNSKDHKPLGRLADDKLRAAKRMAHQFFDVLWKAKCEREAMSKSEARSAGYAWLATEMGIDVKDCHIGLFDAKQCYEVVEICKPYYYNITNIDRLDNEV